MKFGFIYLWYDRKRKRFYIGSHWGTEKDGYICSSKWMRDTYRKRPEDFKRRIIQRMYSRKDLLVEEERWLQLIKPEEMSGYTRTPRYYNLNRGRIGHWSIDTETKKTVGAKISLAHQRPESKKRRQQCARAAWTKEGYRERHTKATLGMRRSETAKQKMKERWTPERRKEQAIRFENVRHRRDAIPHKTCAFCEAMFQPLRSRVRFCSISCGLYNRRREKGNAKRRTRGYSNT